MTVNDIYKSIEEEDLISREKLKLTTQQKVELFKSGFEKTASFVMMITGAVQMGMQSAPRVPRLRQKPPINYKKPVVNKIEAKPVAAGKLPPVTTGDPVIGQGHATVAEYQAEWGRLATAERANVLQSVLTPAQQGRVTMGSAAYLDDAGCVRIAVGSSEPGTYLRPSVRTAVYPWETVVGGTGHAEIKLLNEVDPFAVGAGRPVCPNCVIELQGAGVDIVTPLR